MWAWRVDEGGEGGRGMGDVRMLWEKRGRRVMGGQAGKKGTGGWVSLAQAGGGRAN